MVAGRVLNLAEVEPALNTTPGILLLDGQGMVTFANNVAANILGRPIPTMIGQKYDSCVADPELPPLWAQVDEPTRYELVGEEQGSSATLTVTPMEDSSNARLVTLTPAADMTQLSDALAHTQKLAGIGALTASVAHELTNPISIIATTCETLAAGLVDDALGRAELARFVSMISESARRCARIVEAMRTYTHRSSVALAPADMNQVLKDATLMVAGSFWRHDRVRIVQDLAPDLPVVMADPNQLTQVVINLLTNARDALRPGGGEVTLSTQLSGDGRSAIMTVADNGPGIPARLLAQVFEPFFTTKKAGEGTGLGLSIAAGIVAQHNGRIWAANRPEGGAVLTVCLPKANNN